MPYHLFGRVTRFVLGGLVGILIWNSLSSNDRQAAFKDGTWTVVNKPDVPHRTENLYWQGDYKLVGEPAELKPTKFLGFSGPATGHWHSPRTANNHTPWILWHGKAYACSVVVSGCAIATVTEGDQQVDYLVVASHAGASGLRFYKQRLSEFTSVVSLTLFHTEPYVGTVSATQAETVWFSGDGFKAVWLDQSDYNISSDALPDTGDEQPGRDDTRLNRTREWQFTLNATLTSITTVQVVGDAPAISWSDTFDDTTEIVSVTPAPPPADNEHRYYEGYLTSDVSVTYSHTQVLCSVYVNDTIRRVSRTVEFTYESESSTFQSFTRGHNSGAGTYDIGGTSTTGTGSASGAVTFTLLTPVGSRVHAGTLTCAESGSAQGYTEDPYQTYPSLYSRTGETDGFVAFDGTGVYGTPPSFSFYPKVRVNAAMVLNHIDVYNNVYAYDYFWCEYGETPWESPSGDIKHNHVTAFKQGRYVLDSAALTSPAPTEQNGVTEFEVTNSSYEYTSELTGIPGGEQPPYVWLLTAMDEFQYIAPGTTQSNSWSYSETGTPITWFLHYVTPMSYLSGTSRVSTLPLTGGTVLRKGTSISNNPATIRTRYNKFVDFAYGALGTPAQVFECTYATNDDYDDVVGTDSHFVLPP
jgi:hypothetical protein